MKHRILIFLGLLFVIPTVLADSEIPPFPKVDKPWYGSCYIKQIPEKIRYITNSKHMVIGTEIIEEALVSAYKILPDGSDEFLWSSIGWYAHRVFLTDDCHYLVRMGNWARGNEPSPEDLAIAFYETGELLHSYSTSDLLKEKESVRVTTGHYFWQSQDREFPRLETSSGTFIVQTIEDEVLEFNFKTGVLKND